MRLFLGVPTGGAPAAAFIDGLANIRIPEGIEALERGIVTGNFVPAQREILVSRALAWNADLIAMCDDDVVMPPDALSILCDAVRSDSEIGMAGALYYSRDGLRPMVVEGWDPQDTSRGWIPAFDDRTPVAVDGVGFGCVVLRASAFAAFQPPYFACQIYVERDAGRVRVCNEDYLFGARLRAAGYTVLLHPGVRCGHYDRLRDTIFPRQWETAQATGMRRVLTKSAETYALTPLADAPAATTPEQHVRADVVYVETA